MDSHSSSSCRSGAEKDSVVGGVWIVGNVEELEDEEVVDEGSEFCEEEKGTGRPGCRSKYSTQIRADQRDGLSEIRVEQRDGHGQSQDEFEGDANQRDEFSKMHEDQRDRFSQNLRKKTCKQMSEVCRSLPEAVSKRR